MPSSPETYFSWQNWKEFEPNLDIQLHRKSREHYAYFTEFKAIAETLNVDWDHLDLFFWRETSQREFRKKLSFEGSFDSLAFFWREQLRISFNMIQEARPTCIVVANVLASDIHKVSHNRHLRFSTLRGCYVQNIGGADIPVLLSSMLTGQRALDTHSFKRLIWHIGKELGKAIDFEPKETNQRDGSKQTDKLAED